MDRRNFVGAVTALGTLGKAASGRQAEKASQRTDWMYRTQQQWGPQFYDDKEREQVLDVIETRLPFRHYGPKPSDRPLKVATFEKELAARMQTKYALAVNSGTSALDTAIVALGIGPGDEVIIPAWTWHSDATAVIRAGALPVFAEIDESFNIDPNDIESRITPNTKAIIAVHLIGNPADMDKILAIARKHNLKVLEDAAQAVGGSYKGKPLGSMGDIGIYSHQANKTISAGEGGSIVTSDPLLYERSVRFQDLGSLRPVHSEMLGVKPRDVPFGGGNLRMNELTGGVLLAQLRKLDRMLASSKRHARRIHDGVRDLPGVKFRLMPDPAGDNGVVFFLGFESRERCRRYMANMKQQNVPCGAPAGSVLLPDQSYIKNKISTHPAWPTWNTPRGKSIQYGKERYPRSVDVLDRFAGVPVNPMYTKADTDFIIEAIRKAYPRA